VDAKQSRRALKLCMSENLKDLKIGYTPYSKDFSRPGDRRRFVGYARHRGLNIEIADINQDYDIVFLTYHGDIHKWIEKKKKGQHRFKLIFEIQDHYFAEQTSFKTHLRGFIKYIAGTSSKLYLDFKDLLKEACAIADAVVCTTEEQRNSILPYNKNVHICLDYFEDEIQTIKTDYALRGKKLKLVWEGLGLTVFNLLSIKDTLNTLKDEVELHIVTDPYTYKYANKYIKLETAAILKDIQCDKYFYDWDKSTFNQHIINCDLAIIPIYTDNGLQNGKPENKLILFWLMGMPVLTSSTPAYKRIMEKSDVHFDIKHLEDWYTRIMRYKKLKDSNREKVGQRSLKFAKLNYGREAIGKMWDKAIV
jgi:hypothetical protein